MNTVTVTINGVEYNLKGEENEEYLLQVASYVDRKLKGILDTNSKLGVASAAILTAINTTDEFIKINSKAEEIEKKYENSLQNEKRLNEQIESLNKQLRIIEELNSELQKKSKNRIDDSKIKEKDKEILKLKEEIKITEETAKQYIEENNVLKLENKELKTQAQTAKYKVIDLQNKLIESQIDLARAKKMMK